MVMEIHVTEGDGKRLIILSLLAILLLVVPSPAQECPLSIHPSSNLVHPDISGERVVWEDTDTHDIILYNLSDGIETDLTPDGPGIEEKNPVISGSLVAWEASSSPFDHTEIILLNLTTRTTMTLTPNGSSPAISGNYIAWVNYTQNRYDSNISVYNVSGGYSLMDFIALPQDRPLGGQPAISGDNLIWVNGSNNQYISMKNILSGVETLIYTSPFGNPIPMGGDISNPGISGDWITWSETDGDLWYVYLLDLPSLTEQPVLADNFDPTFSSIDSDRVVWSDGSAISLASVSDVTNTAPLSSDGVNTRPRISGDRVVWYKSLGGPSQIYLSTIGSTDPCPSVSFSAAPESGVRDLTVQFNDTSATNETHSHWLWDFGDGTVSYEKNPRHNYTADGTYSVSLTASNAVGRGYASRPGLIRVGAIPVASFSADRTYGIVPLTVRFTDTSSGNPDTWVWDLNGDGLSESTSQNPTYTYSIPGVYTVNFSVNNTFGPPDTVNITGYIRALNGTSLTSNTVIAGLDVTTVGGTQQITVDTARIGSTFNPAENNSWIILSPPASTGWERMDFFSMDGIGFNKSGGLLRGNVTSCILESRDLLPTTFGTDIGNNLPVAYILYLSAYPVNAGIDATIWEGVIPGDDAAFRKTIAETSRDFTSILGTAYTLDFVTRNLTGVQSATLNLSVSGAWVQKYGNQNNIAVVRLGDDLVNQTLNPTATFTDTAANLDFFTIPSPHGLSRFALVSAVGSSNLIQMGAHVATQYIQGSGSGYTSGVSKSASQWESTPAPAKPAAPRPAATYYGEGKIDTTPAGIVRDPVIIGAEDRGASLSIGAGVVAMDEARNPLTLVTVKNVPGGSIPPVPNEAGTLLAGTAYDIGPDGATFDPPATVSITVPGNQWNPDTRYTIRSYSAQAGSWEEVPTSVDTGNQAVTGRVSHLCLFGLFAATPAASATLAPAGQPAMATQVMQPGPVARTPMGIFTGMIGWLYTTARVNLAVSVTVLLGVVVSLALFTRRTWLSRHRTWITLYLASLTGLLWAAFLLVSGGPLWESSFILIIVAGLNLIVHLLRFDRIEIHLRAPDPLRV